jgi:glycosyltransferase involved in cell wall biosynthesis
MLLGTLSSRSAAGEHEVKDRLRLVVVPTDPVAAAEEKRAGYSRLPEYFNPTGMFHDIIVLSPLEQGERWVQNMWVRGVSPREFARVLHEVRPDVVRAYGGHWPADLVCRNRIPGVPVIVSVHDARWDLIHPALRYADLVICVSNIVKQRVLRVGVKMRQIRVVSNRVDTTLFRPISNSDNLATVAKHFAPGKHILHVGRRDPVKNPDTLIRALDLLPAEYSCVFVGMGDNTPYAGLAEKLGVQGRCFWVDAVKKTELPLWYSWCDCFCVPSRSEGFGTVFIEAAACGAPVVTSDIAPMNEYFTPDVSACLVKNYEDPYALASAIRRVCEDDRYRQRISAEAVRVAQRFDKRTIDAAEAAIYREALSLPSPSFARRVQIAGWKAEDTLRFYAGQCRKHIGRSGLWKRIKAIRRQRPPSVEERLS